MKSLASRSELPESWRRSQTSLRCRQCESGSSRHRGSLEGRGARIRFSFSDRNDSVTWSCSDESEEHCYRCRENRSSTKATAMLPKARKRMFVVDEWVMVDAIANTARPILSVNTLLTTRHTVKPLSV